MNMNKSGTSSANQRAKLLAAFAVIAMVVCALCVIVPVSDAADEPELQEKELPEASSGVITITENGIYTLDADIEGSIIINTGVTAVIDLAGFDIIQNATGSGDQADNTYLTGSTIVNNGTLTINDSVGESQVFQTAETTTVSALVNNTGATAILNGGFYKSNAYAIKNLGTLTINEGVKVSTDKESVKTDGVWAGTSLIANGWYTGSNNAGSVQAILTINGGDFSNGLNTLKNDDWGVATINGGTFTANAQAVVMNWNQLTVNNGTYVANEYLFLNAKLEANAYDAGALTINGGEFQTAAGYPAIMKTSGYSGSSIGTITIGEAVSGIDILVPNGEVINGTVAYGANKATINGTAGEGGVTFTQGSVTVSGNIVSGDGSAGEVAAAISAVTGDVVLRDLTITEGTLTVDGNVEVRGTLTVSKDAGITVSDGVTLTVARGATLANEGAVTINGEVVSNGNVVNNGSIDGSGKLSGNVNTTAGSISGVDTSDAVNSADILEYTISGGSVSDNTTIPSNQRLIVAEGGVWVIESGVTLTIEGELVINGTLIVSEGASVIVGTDGLGAKVQVNGEVQSSGNFTVSNGTVEVANNFNATEGQVAVEGGVISVDGVLTIGIDAAVYTSGFSNGCITVNADGALNIYGLVGVAGYTNAYVINYGNIAIDNGQAERLDADGNSVAPVANQLYIRGYADGSTVTISSYLLETNGSLLRINDFNMELGTGSNTITTGANGVPYNQIEFKNTGSDAIILSGTAVVTQNVSGSYARGFTHTLDISGNLYATYVDSNASTDDPSNLVSMTLAGARYAADSDSEGGIIVSTTLSIDKTVAVSNSGKLDVSGQVSMPESTIANTGVVSIVGEDGFIRVNNTAIGATVNGVMYQTREGTGAGTLYHNYASFANAIDGVTAETNLNTSKTVTVLGEVDVAADVAVPSPVSVVVNGDLTIGSEEDRDVTVTLANGARSSGSGSITVYGSLTYENKRNDGVADTVADVITESEERDGYRTYTNIYTALAGANPGDTVTVSKTEGYVDVSENITIPEGVTLSVPDGSAPLVLADGVTMTVDGTLDTAVDIYARTMFAVTASNIDSSSAAGANASAIVVNGTIVSAGEITYGLTAERNATVTGITGNVAAASAGVPVAGAYYETTDGYVISALGIAISADVLADITSEKIIVNGAVTVGDVAFASEDGCTEIEVASSITSVPTGMTAPETVLTVGSLTLTGTKLTVNGAFNGDVVVGDATLTVANVTALTVKDSNGMVVYGTAVAEIGGEDVEGTLAVAAGSVVFGSSTAFTTTSVAVSVAAGATLVSNGATFNEITVDGVLDITTATSGNKSVTATDMTVNETGSVEVASGERVTVNGDLVVYGTFTVAASTSTAAPGTAQIANLFVGFTRDDAKEGNEATTGTVSGPITVTTLAYVSPEATVDAAVQAVLDEKNRAEFMVEGALWFTAYANGEVTTPADVPVENVRLTGWTVSGTTTPVQNPITAGQPYAVSEDCVLTANIDRNIYTVYVIADINAVSSITVDGNMMTYGLINDSTSDQIYYGFMATVAAGNHTIQYELANGYSGTGVLSVLSGNTTVSGTTFTTAGTEAADTSLMLQLTGFEKSGYVPDSPDTPSDSGSSDDGMTITDYLLIILVVLIIVMAIIVAMRLMRS